MSRDYEAEVARFFEGVARLSRLIPQVATESEKQIAEGKKAVFVIKGLKRAYAFEVQGSQLRVIEDLTGMDTICFAKDPAKFLEYCDKVFMEGDTAAFERAIQRGDLVLTGTHSLHDRILWRRAFERLARVRETYAR